MLQKKAALTVAFIAISFLSFGLAAQPVPDPTRPSGFVAGADAVASQFRLQSILSGDSRRIAIINGSSYAEGDGMALGRLVSIGKDSVVIQGRERHVLRLGAESIKKQTEKQ